MTDNEEAHYIECIRLVRCIAIVRREEPDVCQSRKEDQRTRKLNNEINTIYDYSRCSVEQQLTYLSKLCNLN